VDLFYNTSNDILRRNKLTIIKILKCECGNKDQSMFFTASDGEIVCGKCGAVIDQIEIKNTDDGEGEIECWDGELDLCRNLLEERVSKNGW
jgi:hypothetical protein